jgi:hypothetical protein
MDNRKNKSACLILSSTFLALALTLSACGNTNPPTSSPDANSVTTSSKQTVALAAPVVSLNGKNVCWNAVPGATSYLVNIDGNESEVTATSYSLESLTDPKDYSVSVKAKAGEVVSSSSNVVTYVLTVTLATPGHRHFWQPRQLGGRRQSHFLRSLCERGFRYDRKRNALRDHG